MKICTGERYQGESLALSLIEGWHGKHGHINVLELDHNAACTGHGKHNRVVAFCPEGSTLDVRVDNVWGLPAPSLAQILKAASAQNGEKYSRKKWQLRAVVHEERSSFYQFIRKEVK